MRIKRKKNNNIILFIIITMISLFFVAGGMYYFSKKSNENTEDNTNKITVIGEAQIRTGPDEEYPTLKNISSGEKVVKLSQNEMWYEIETSDKYVGWIPGWLVQGSNIKSPDDENREKLKKYTVILNPLINLDDKKDNNGIYGKTYNLQIAKKLEEKLKSDGIKVELTRKSDDENPTTEDIKKIAVDKKADVLVDITTLYDEKNSDFGVGITYGSNSSSILARSIEKVLSQHYLSKVASAKKQDSFNLISEKLPHVKINSANLADKVEGDILNDKRISEQYIKSLQEGIENYLYYLIGIENYTVKRKEQLLNLPQKGMNIPFYYTKQEAYKNISYGSDNTKTIESNGDAIISLAMIANYLSPNEAPKVSDIAEWAGNKYYIKNQGTTPTIVSKFAEKYNYKVENIDLDNINKIVDAIKDNKPVLVRLKSGLFGSKVTYKVIRGYEDDKFYINDPDDDDAKLNSYNGFTKNDMETNTAQAWIFSK